MKLTLRHLASLPAIVLVSSLFLKENFNSIGIILFIGFTLFSIFRKRDFQLVKTALIAGLPLVAYFLVAALGFVLNTSSNASYLLRLLPFLLSPIFIYYYRSGSTYKTVVLTFAVANLLFLIFLDCLAMWDMVHAKSLFVTENGKENYRFLYTRFTAGFFNHIYLSIYCLFSIGILAQFKPVKNKMLNFSAIAYLLFHIAILGSRSVVIGLLIASVVFLILKSVSSRKNLKYLLLLVAGLSLAVGFIYAYKDTLLMNRYAQAFEWYENKDLLLERDYSVNNRAKLYIIGLSMFWDISRYGINGTGVVTTEIKQKYQMDYSDEFSLNTITYNAHNQYINNFIDWGITGLLLTITLMVLPIRSCFRSGFYWISLFWLAFSIILMMESVLIRHKGIVFFTIFFALFAFQKNLVRNAQ